MKVMAQKNKGLVEINGLSDEGAELVKRMLVGVLSDIKVEGAHRIRALDVKDAFRSSIRWINGVRLG